MSPHRTPLVVAAILAVLAGVLVHRSLAAREKEVRKGWDLVPILVASAELDVGGELTLDGLAASQMPERFVSPSMVGPEHADTLVGQRLAVPLRPGDPVLWSHFEPRKEAGRLSAKVMKRARAVTVSVTEKSSVGGWIRPNDHVDVLATFQDPSNQQMATITLLQNVIVLATGKEAGASGGRIWDRGYADVSLLVLPEEAEILVLAQEMGTITLVLRHPEESDTDRDRGRATVGTLLTGERTKTLEKIRHETIQVIRGNRAVGLSLP